MMTLTGGRDSSKALPADIRAAFTPQTYYGGSGANRLMRNADVVQQRGGEYGLRGLYGLGCDPDAGDLDGCDTSALQDPGSLPPLTESGSTGYLQWTPPGTTAQVPYVPPGTNGGVDLAAIAKIIQAGAGSLVPIIAATSQGVLYKVDPKTGQMTVYSQPSGST